MQQTCVNAKGKKMKGKARIVAICWRNIAIVVFQTWNGSFPILNRKRLSLDFDNHQNKRPVEIREVKKEVT